MSCHVLSPAFGGGCDMTAGVDQSFNFLLAIGIKKLIYYNSNSKL